jgi:hypothetical protein
MVMRFLVITPGLPYPPKFGGQLAWYHNLRGLRAAGASVLLVSARTRNDDLGAFVEHASQLCDGFRCFPMRHHVYRALHPRRPYYANALVPSAHDAEALRGFLRREGNGIDVVWLEHPYVHEVFAALEPVLPRQVRLVLRHHNHERSFYHAMFRDARWTSPRKAFYLAEEVRMAGYEAHILDRVDRIACVSERDARRLAPTGKAFWYPIVFQPGEVEPGLDPSADVAVRQDLHRRFSGSAVLLFGSSFIGGANVKVVEWFLRDVLPGIRARRPDVAFLFGGSQADRYFPEFPAPGAQRFANVPSIRPYLERADLNVILSFSTAGVKLKLLQALAWRKKTVATSGGVAGSGMESVLPHADEPDALATLCVRALAGDIDFRPIWEQYADLYHPQRAIAELLQRLEHA